jgi:8-oxo-dGTP diphosphatase
MIEPITVRAAGTVTWRPGEHGDVEIVVVHRPGLGDWSLPKGKLEPDETPAAAAVRETREETGSRPVLVRLLGEVSYHADRPRPGRKVVCYFAGKAGTSSFEPSREVDEIRWLSPAQAAPMLTYDTDRTVLDEFTALPADTRTVLLVRHAKAGRRSDWSGPDEQRPLSPAGWAQAAGLRRMLPLFRPTSVHTADPTRCVQTVAGLADDLGVPVIGEPLLSEDAFRRDPDSATERFLAIAEQQNVPVICSQGGVIPGLIRRIARRSGLPINDVPCKKGSTWVLSFDPVKPRHLLAAGYLPTALPTPGPG